MIKPNEEIARAILNLQDNSSFELLAKWIHDSAVDISIRNNASVGDMTLKNQGRALELYELLGHLEKAYTYLMNIKQDKKIEEIRDNVRRMK